MERLEKTSNFVDLEITPLQLDEDQNVDGELDLEPLVGPDEQLELGLDLDNNTDLDLELVDLDNIISDDAASEELVISNSIERYQRIMQNNYIYNSIGEKNQGERQRTTLKRKFLTELKKITSEELDVPDDMRKEFKSQVASFLINLKEQLNNPSDNIFLAMDFKQFHDTFKIPQLLFVSNPSRLKLRNIIETFLINLKELHHQFNFSSISGNFDELESIKLVDVRNMKLFLPSFRQELVCPYCNETDIKHTLLNFTKSNLDLKTSSTNLFFEHIPCKCPKCGRYICLGEDMEESLNKALSLKLSDLDVTLAGTNFESVSDEIFKPSPDILTSVGIDVDFDSDQSIELLSRHHNANRSLAEELHQKKLNYNSMMIGVEKKKLQHLLSKSLTSKDSNRRNLFIYNSKFLLSKDTTMEDLVFGTVANTPLFTQIFKEQQALDIAKRGSLLLSKLKHSLDYLIQEGVDINKELSTIFDFINANLKTIYNGKGSIKLTLDNYKKIAPTYKHYADSCYNDIQDEIVSREKAIQDYLEFFLDNPFEILLCATPLTQKNSAKKVLSLCKDSYMVDRLIDICYESVATVCWYNYNLDCGYTEIQNSSVKFCKRGATQKEVDSALKQLSRYHVVDESYDTYSKYIYNVSSLMPMFDTALRKNNNKYLIIYFITALRHSTDINKYPELLKCVESIFTKEELNAYDEIYYRFAKARKALQQSELFETYFILTSVLGFDSQEVLEFVEKGQCTFDCRQIMVKKKDATLSFYLDSAGSINTYEPDDAQLDYHYKDLVKLLTLYVGWGLFDKKSTPMYMNLHPEVRAFLLSATLYEVECGVQFVPRFHSIRYKIDKPKFSLIMSDLERSLKLVSYLNDELPVSTRQLVLSQEQKAEHAEEELAAGAEGESLPDLLQNTILLFNELDMEAPTKFNLLISLLNKELSAVVLPKTLQVLLNTDIPGVDMKLLAAIVKMLYKKNFDYPVIAELFGNGTNLRAMLVNKYKSEIISFLKDLKTKVRYSQYLTLITEGDLLEFEV